MRIHPGFRKRLAVFTLCAVCLVSFSPNPTAAQSLPPAPARRLPSAPDPSLPSPRLRFDHPLTLDAPLSGGFLEDSDGFFWIATQNGVVRWDGYEQKVYRAGPDSISNDFVVAITEDRDGEIWFASSGGGLDRYDKRTNTFRNYRHSPDNPDSLAEDVIALSPHTLWVDRAGSLWVGTSTGGLDRFDKKTDTFIHHTHDPANSDSLSDNSVWSVFEDSQGRLWVGTQTGGLDEFDRSSGKFRHHAADPGNPQTLQGNWVYTIIEDKDNPTILWVATWDGGLNKFDKTTEHFTRYSRSPGLKAEEAQDGALGLYDDGQGQVWIGWFHEPLGLSVFDKQAETFTFYQHNFRDPFGLSSSANITNIFADRSGAVWLLYPAQGLDRYSPRAQRFRLYQNNPFDPASLSSNAVVPFYVDRAGTIWIGTYDAGLNRYNRETDTFTSYQADPADPAALPNNFVSRIYEDSSGAFWVATRGGALCLFDRAASKCTQIYRHDPHDPASLPAHDTIRYILEDRNNPNLLWMGAYLGGGLFQFDKAASAFKLYPSDPSNPQALSSGDVVHLYQDAAGSLWISTAGGGLNRFDPATGLCTRFQNEPDNPASLGANFVWEVQEFTPGTLWVATLGGGLNQFEIATGRVVRYTQDTGFPANTILTLRQDQAGNLWMGTDEGLVRYNPTTGQTRLYTKDDGLHGNVFLDAAALVAPDGEMWFGGLGGIDRFYPEQVVDNPYVPPVVLTALRQGGEPMKLDAAPEKTNGIRLDWQHNYFEFEAAALDFTLPRKNQYRYQLEGFDKDWYAAGTSHSGRYSGLRGGAYTLRIVGSNNDGVWNTQGVSLQVTVTSPVWEAWWFYLLIGSLLVIGLLGAYGYRSRQLKAARTVAQALRESEERYRQLNLGLEQRVRERTVQLEATNQELEAFGYSVSHDLHAPLRSLHGFSQALLEDHGRQLDAEGHRLLQRIRASAEHMSQRVDALLELSRVTQGDLQRVTVDLSRLAQTIADELRQSEPARPAEFVIAPGLAVQADERLMQSVLENLLGNAWKFTAQRQPARIEFGCRLRSPAPNEAPGNGREVVYFVRDNVAGFEMAHADRLFGAFQRLHSTAEFPGTGIGLSMVKRIIHRHGGRVWAEGAVEQGATFYFTWP